MAVDVRGLYWRSVPGRPSDSGRSTERQGVPWAARSSDGPTCCPAVVLSGQGSRSAWVSRATPETSCRRLLVRPGRPEAAWLPVGACGGVRPGNGLVTGGWARPSGRYCDREAGEVAPHTLP